MAPKASMTSSELFKAILVGKDILVKARKLCIMCILYIVYCPCIGIGGIFMGFMKGKASNTVHFIAVSSMLLQCSAFS